MSIVTVISFNIWSGEYCKRERTEWLLNNVIDQAPDILLLQEVSNANVLEITARLREKKYEYKVANAGRKVYELIASKWPINDYAFSKFSTSRTGRGLLWAIVKIRGKPVTIGCAQFEQTPSEVKKRIGQLDCAQSFLAQRGQNCIFGCDTGFQPDELYTLPEWNDAWSVAGKNQLAMYTIDSKRNTHFDDKQLTQSRPDRIYYQGNFKNSTYTLLGTEQTSGVHPSTHFGIKMTLYFL